LAQLCKAARPAACSAKILEVAFPVRIRYHLFIGLVPFVFGFLVFHRPSCQMSRERTTRLFSTIQGTSPASSLLFLVSVPLGYSPETSPKLTISLAPFQRATSYFPSLASFAATCAAFFLVGLRNLLKKKQNSRNCGLYCTFPVILLTATVIVSAASVILLGMLGQFRIVGRHFMPLFPFFLLSLSVTPQIAC
jgi:hypothetical protein